MIRELLKSSVQTYRTLGSPNVLYEYVLEEGEEFAKFEEFPFPIMEPNQCFSNATMTNFLNPFGPDSDIYYVEGFMVRKGIGLPIHHAWVECDGIGYDPTIQTFQDCQYFGVKFSPEKTFEETHKNGFYGLFIPDGININFDLLMETQVELVNEILEMHRKPPKGDIF